MIQFLKWKKDTGEMLFEHENYEIFQFGREGWHGFKNLTDDDFIEVENGLHFLERHLAGFRPNLLILDEINLAAYLGMIEIEPFILFIKNWMEILPEMNIVFTGRHAPEEFLDLADFVNIIVSKKAPKDFVCTEGIQW